MHTYTITDRKTGEQTPLIAPNRDAALKAYVRRRLVVTRAKNTDEPPPPQDKPFALPGGPEAGSVG